MSSRKEETGEVKLRWICAIVSPLVLSLMLAACGGGEAPTQPPIEPATVPALVPTEAPATGLPVALGPTAMPLDSQPVIPTALEGQPSAIANYNAWIYGGPGQDYVVYAAFLGANTAQVVGKSQDGLWWAISVPVAPGGNGWVEASWVSVSNVDNVPALPPPPVPPTTKLLPPGPEDPQATALGNTYVRSGPGTTYPPYGVAPAGRAGRVLGKSEDGAWWAVRIDPSVVAAGYGWVSTSTVQASKVQDVLVIAAPPQLEAQPPVRPAEGAPSATAAEYVNVRSGPGTCYAALMLAPPGAAGEVVGKSADGLWWQLKVPPEVSADGLGWVSVAYVVTTDVELVAESSGDPCQATDVPAPGFFACALTAQSPTDYTALAAGSSFDMEWQVQNIGANSWAESVAEFVKAGKTGRLHTPPDSYDLPQGVPSGKRVTVTVPAKVPSGAKTYGELWRITSHGEAVCEFWMIVNVK